MDSLKYDSFMYPSDFNQRLAEKRAAEALEAAQLDTERTFLSEKIGRQADATTRRMGDLIIKGLTGGILQATFDTESQESETTITPTLARKFGAPVRHLVLIDNSPMLTSVKFEQEASAIREQAIVGYAEQQAA